jgi:uncharacterized membrane protein
MPDNNVIAVSFEQSSSSYEALSKLKELDGQGQVGVSGSAVVERSQDGHLVTKDQTEDPHLEGTATGGLVGLIIGILGGPFGVLIGGATGLLVGSIFDLEDSDDEGSVLAEISNTVKPGQTVLLAVVSEQSDDVVDNAMGQLGGKVLRRSVADVEAEIAAAEEAQRAAKHEARAKLRAERREHISDTARAKVDALKAKL